MRHLLLIIALVTAIVLPPSAKALDPDAIRVTLMTHDGGDTRQTFLDPFSGANWLVGYSGDGLDAQRYFFGSGLSVTSTDGSGNRTISVTPAAARTVSQVTRTANSAFQISTMRDAFVTYYEGVSVGALLSVTAVTATANIRYADNSGMSTNVVNFPSISSGAGGVLNLSNIGSLTLSGVIPVGKWVMIVVSTSGSPTLTGPAGQEVLLP